MRHEEAHVGEHRARIHGLLVEALSFCFRYFSIVQLPIESMRR
jgi:hypothetical protein